MSDYTPHTEISGTKDIPVILLLNSLGTTTRMWEPQLPLLEQHYRVIRMDTRGHGQSAAPAGPYSFDDLVSDALGTLDRHGVKTASVMGCSLGSMTALGMGAAILADKGVAGLWDGSLGNWLTPAFREAEPATVDMLKTEFLKTTPEGYLGCAAALKGLDYLKDLPNLKVPTLFVSGSEDKGAAPAVMEEMASQTPGSAYANIPDAGHIINVNAPKCFSLAILDFLEMTAG